MERTTAPLTHHRRPRSWWLLLVVLALIAAACGGSDDGDDDGATGGTDTSTSGGDDVDPDGVLRMGTNIAGSGQGFHFDTLTSSLRTDLPWMSVVFGTLLRESEEGVPEPWMAETVEVVDPQTIKLTIRDGLTFTDGEAYDAEAVRTSLLRTRDRATEAAKGSRSAGFNALADVVVDGPLALTIKLSAPESTEFLWALAAREGTVVSPKQADLPVGAVDAAPVGAGPYKVKELKADQLIALEKNPDFPDADDWRVKELHWIQTPDGPAATSGLLAGALDITFILPNDDVPKVSADDRFAVKQVANDSNYVSMPVCYDLPPFDKLEVRQAVQAAIDVEQIIDVAYDGRAKPMYGLWPEGHANFNPKVKPLRAHDPSKAKELLRKAGVSNLSFDLYLLQGLGYERMTELIQAQLEEVGITMNIKPTSNIIGDFFQAHRAGATIIPNIRSRADKYNRLYGDAVSVSCGKRDDIMTAVRSTSALPPDDPRVAKAYQEAELLAARFVNPIPLVFVPDNVAYAKDKIGGEVSFQPLARVAEGIMLDRIYVKK